jgi:diguanylate cyclase (GGDEF)-like protein
VSLAVKTTAVVALVLAALLLAVAMAPADASPWVLALGFSTAFATIVIFLHRAVIRPMAELVERSRRRLGENFERSDPRYRDETRELVYLVGALISVFTAAEDKEWVSQSVKEDLLRTHALNRRLVDVAELGREMNAALPYRETIERVLTCVRSFLGADFAALLTLDEETDAFSVEGIHGTLSSTLSTQCCASVSDCPVKGAMARRSVTRSRGHECSLFPPALTEQIVMPFAPGEAGDLALVVSGVAHECLDLLTEDTMALLHEHVQSALANSRKYDAIRRQVVTDHLTSLYNRRFFMTRGHEEIERSLRHKMPLCILMLDIDHFKLFNDAYGHATGDRVLQTVARALQTTLRTSDICARYGGEEFAMLLPNTSGDNGYHVAERVRRTLAGTRYTGLGLPDDVRITISAGVATCPQDATSLDELMELSDQALYAAKRAGRDRVALHSPARRWATL